jgi:NAD(P)-dependent dehydrogenase (short-subunit alcohol dehydrogenase family)
MISRGFDRSVMPLLLPPLSQSKGKTPFVNAVVANAGALGPVTGVPERSQVAIVGDIQKDLWNVSVEDTKLMVETNLIGSFMTFLAFVNLLDAGNKHPDSPGKAGLVQSQFITVTTYAAFARIEGPSHLYGAAKTALTHLTKTLSSHFARYRIRANSISPGLYVTEMTAVSILFPWNRRL